MLRDRFTNDCHALTKKNPPAHSTTGVVNKNCNHEKMCGGNNFPKLSAGTISPTARITIGIVIANPTQNLSDNEPISNSSSPASLPPGASGSRCIPHLGQSPGPSCRISGCMGQV